MLLKFLRDRRGNILPIFAITLVPLIVTTGGVVDYSRAYDQKTAVQDSMDSAALAAGKKIGLVSDDVVKADAKNFFETNVVSKVDSLPILHTEIAASTITLTTNLTVPTYFLGIIGLRQFDFPLVAKATLAMGTLEVAMVLDNSTSMNMPSSKMATLKTAAVNLTNTLYNLAATSNKPDPIKVALVPFGASVNVGPDASFVDTTGLGTNNADALKDASMLGAANVAPAGTHNAGLFKYLQDSRGRPITWAGCVEERPAPYDVSDDPPSSNPDTQFVPMFAPDEPDNWTCTTGKCAYAGDGSRRRYSGAPGGNQSYNNYLPDNGDATTCPDDYNAVTMTRATPTEFTRNNHGLSVGSEIVFSTTGSLYSGISADTPYYVTKVVSSSKFLVSDQSSGSTVTMTRASPAVFTSSRHGLKAGDAVMLTTSGSLYSGFDTSTVYYVISSGLSTNNFRLSRTSGGSAVNSSGSQSGTHRFVKLAASSGSQSGTHYYNETGNFTCDNGNANCGGTGVGKSEKTAFGGASVSTAKMCKYGSAGRKATIADITFSGLEGGPNFMCSTTPVMPLTTVKQDVVDAINRQQPNGYTNITAGVMWGWRTLSEGAPFTEGRPYNDRENQKIMIVMTDGENTYLPFMEKDKNPSTSNSYAGKFVKSAYGAWSYLFRNHIGTTASDSATVFSHLNGRTAQACANAKAAGIRVYTVAFQVTDSDTRDMLRTCATDSSKAFESSDNNALLAAFSAIGDDISLLRISQ